MTLKRYGYRCPACKTEHESEQMRGAQCPECGALSMRLYTSKPAFHPTHSLRTSND